MECLGSLQHLTPVAPKSDLLDPQPSYSSQCKYLWPPIPLCWWIRHTLRAMSWMTPWKFWHCSWINWILESRGRCGMFLADCYPTSLEKGNYRAHCGTLGTNGLGCPPSESCALLYTWRQHPQKELRSTPSIQPQVEGFPTVPLFGRFETAQTQLYPVSVPLSTGRNLPTAGKLIEQSWGHTKVVCMSTGLFCQPSHLKT